MKNNNFSVSDLVPHSGVMSLLDSIDSYTNDTLVASVAIREESVFFENNKGVPAAIGIEYMGQAVAAFAGVGARQKNNPVKIGFLVSSRKYLSNVAYFPLGSELVVEVIELGAPVNGLQVFDCTIKATGVDVSAKLNVYLPDDASEFLRNAANG